MSFDNSVAVSVIIPVYNTEKYLEECLESVVAQSLRDIEVICVNDGSTDGSLNILNRYAEKDSRVKVYSQENQGLSVTRNNGAKKAVGEYIYFFDSDDVLAQNALRDFYEKAKSGELEAVFCDGSSFSDDEEECKDEVEKYKTYYTRTHEYPDVCTGPQMFVQMLKNNEYRMNCALHMVKREYFLDKELWFEPGIVQEDNLYMFSCMLQAKRVGYIHEAYYNRRVRKNSIMTSKKAFKNTYGYFVCYLKMKKLWQKLELSEEERAAAVDVIGRNRWNAVTIYNEIVETEKAKVSELKDPMRLLFEVEIVSVADRRERLKKDNKIKTEKLERIYREKTDLNAKLQQTYKEKTEIGAKLQQACKEKSEINKKLKITYDEKFERGQEIKRLKQENKELSKNIGVRIERKIKKIKKIQKSC